jgi:hypothetical protein
MAAMDFEIIEQQVPELSRDLIESMNKDVKLTDSKDGLDLFCYIKCAASDSSLLKNCRGIVFKGDKLVMNGFPYTYEFSEDNREEIDDIIKGIFDDCTFYDSYEGTVIRMFNHDGIWYTSTNRKLDAYKSKWSSKDSFGLFFRQALHSEYDNNEDFRNRISTDESRDIIERYQETLDVDKQYMFLLINNSENRIVCQPPSRPTVYHVGTFINGKLNMEENINIPYPQKHNFKSIEEIYDYASKVDISKLQGVIVFAPNNVQYKIFSKDYAYLYRVRGNEPSIKFRYLQVRQDKEFVKLLKELYPNFTKTFEEYENILLEIAKNINRAYVDRFIRNLYVSVPQEEYGVIRSCHEWHINDRSRNKISLSKVIEVLNQQEATSLNKMIKRYYLEQKNKLNPQRNRQKINNETDFPELKRSA